MKKISFVVATLAVAVFASACGNQAGTSPRETFKSEDKTESEKKTETETKVKDESAENASLDDIKSSLEKDIEDFKATLDEDYEKITADIDSYEKYLQSVDQVKSYYDKVLSDTRNICLKMREYSISYAETIMALNEDNSDIYDDLEDIYDDIYDDAGENVYDYSYDGVLDDIYDEIYDGILDDAYDDGVDYREWSDARSNEYEMWSDTRSDVYEEWSDTRSDIYEFWTDLRGRIFEDKADKAADEIKDFKEKTEKMKNGDDNSQADDSDEDKAMDSEAPETEASQMDSPATEEAETKAAGSVSSDLVDGMRPEFKEAMDSYEAFYDKYCDFMKKYNENPTDLELITQYTGMLQELTDMETKFAAWQGEDLNTAELKYYTEVTTRVTQKLLDVAQ